MKPLARWCVIVAVPILAAACPGPGDVVQHHPIAEHFSDQPAQIITIDFAERSARITAAQETLRAVATRSPILRIGVVDSPTEDAIGDIRGAVEYDRRLLILDGHFNRIRIHDRDGGQLVSAVGRQGHGPGEFIRPVGMTLVNQEVLVVADALGRINVFALADSIAFERSFEFPGDVWDVCALDGELFLHGMRTGASKVIHVYSLDGQLLRSFGEPYHGGTRVVRYHLSRGKLACVESAGWVLVAPESLPRVFGFDRVGTPVWRVEMDGFSPVDVLEMASGSSLLQVPDRPWHRSTALVMADVDSAWLQITEYPGKDLEGAPRLHTWILSPIEGTSTYMGGDWPELVRVSAERILAKRSTPFPQLLILERAESP